MKRNLVIEVSEIMEMGYQDVRSMVNYEQYEKIEEEYGTFESFTDLYIEGAKMSDEDKFITPWDYYQEGLEY